ncbi:aromatic ring-hydroxylating oxygenase subunit alpha, partial [Actinocorallia lasiicapitis]
MFRSRNHNYTVPSEGVIEPYTPAVSPLPDPNGWFCLGASHEVAPGSLVTRRLLAQDVVLWRTRSGKLVANRPYCPHLGAHLGQGGTVRDESIVCPFHEFAFGPEGGCVRTAYGSRPAAKTRLATLPVDEINGLIFVWYHHEGAPPGWRIPALPAEGYSRPYYKTTETAGHPQEVLENVIDTGHLATLHAPALAASSAAVPFRADGPGSSITLRMAVRIPFTHRYRTADYQVTMFGLGFILATIELPLGIVLRVYALPTSVGVWRMQARWVVSARVPAPRLLPPPLRGPFAA